MFQAAYPGANALLCDSAYLRSSRAARSRRNVKTTGYAKSGTVKLRPYGFRLTPDQPAAYSRYRAALGTFSIHLDVNFCYEGGLQMIAETGISLSLMWCGCGSERRGMPDNSVSHTEGGCGNSRNQGKKCGGRATATCKGGAR